MAFAGFGKNSGPSVPPRGPIPFGSFPSPPNPNPNPNPNIDRTTPVIAATRPMVWQRLRASPPKPERTATSPNWGNQSKQPLSLPITNHQRLSPVAAKGTVYDASANLPTKETSPFASKRTRSLPLSSHEDDILEQYNPAHDRRSTVSPNWGNESKQPVNRPSITNNQRFSPVIADGTAHNSGDKFPTKPTIFQAANRSLSPPSSNEEDILGLYTPANHTARRYDVSPPKVRSRKNSPVADSVGSQRLHIANSSNSPSANQRSDIMGSSFVAHAAASLSPPSTAAKRARSPPLLDTDAFSTESPIHLDAEREMQLKAKRLARFHTELSQPLETVHDRVRDKFSGNKQDQAPFTPMKNADKLVEDAREVATVGTISDNEALGSSTIVVGLCPDMCPELEREERERKGDLDKFERLDGDRNQTNKFIAVKKYNRTAEREPDLIRPLPVLQMTLDYLLNLLDQPYDENFLGIYNFLWDRMRAVRMDLRMQHIFNHKAILMLEQMIRLHIAAMHELCEYKKGEGFSEGFDAHLNIEQMNKASVELFQMYEDHRKKGKYVPTEKEFRGYYALLKLDKHPGYKVEPAELSLDLAKMTPEMRCTSEILFAREVARACRFGNYVAFFRLARKASYLQACLMHAHFAKLRTQALASLHSGLQNNQGIPISHVVIWLGMEGEYVDSLLEYHGFSLRRYDELYMVKEGPFLNSDTDFPTKCSQLVHLKKSRRIVNDVKSCPTLSEVTGGRKSVSDVINMVNHRISPSKTEVWTNVDGEEMLENKAKSTVRTITQPWQLHEGPPIAISNKETDRKNSAAWTVSQSRQLHERPPVAISNKRADRKIAEGTFSIRNIDKGLQTEATVAILNREYDHEMVEVSLKGASSIIEGESVLDQEKYAEDGPTVEITGPVRWTSMDRPALPKPEECIDQAGVTASTNVDSIDVNSLPRRDVDKFLENRASILVSQQKDEALREKLKIIIRKWKRGSSMLKKAREHKAFLANAALSSLSLGPPVRRKTEVQLSNASGEINIDFIARERYVRQRTSWAMLNVSEVIAPILCARNPFAKCICWKALILGQENDTESQTYNLASRWLVSKLMGTGMVSENELVVSMPGISIWKKWFVSQFSPSQTCCLSVIREIKLNNNLEVLEDDILDGSSCFMYLVSENIPWEIQKFRLHKLLASLPSGYRLPILILNSDSGNIDTADPSYTMSRLGLHETDNTSISSSSVVFLTGSSYSGHANSFFDDNQLREGLQWLANHSPVQPTVHLVKTRELVLSFMKRSLETLENMNVKEVNPDHCISSFNEALNRAAEEIVAAASANPNHWPSPELNLLDDSSDEQLIADMNLPSVGWSSVERIKSTVVSIKGCSLPSFPSDISWMSKGCPIGIEIENQKLAIEECLISYMTRSLRLLNADLATREASVMLQQGAGLELRDSCIHIVPRWLMIFRRIYNWQLMRLAGKGISESYVLVQTDPTNLLQMDAVTPSKSADTVVKYLHSYFCCEDYQPQTRLSLDELVEVSCSVPLSSQQPISGLERTSIPSDEIIRNVGSPAEANIGAGKDDDEEYIRLSNSSSDVDINEQSQVSPLGSSNSRLAKLLEKCNHLQDVIDSKLAIFF
ncbi:SAC3 family protein B isoform X3 [Iris pallida]|uniref:SAC3 family protein B isoform X3 n=2 Tax=Iris pallida TaxID=29817 RepID=A0AAX6E8H6_IRIPA|nr:SAC3 family protein B isoform X3 [Iris pallida]